MKRQNKTQKAAAVPPKVIYVTLLVLFLLLMTISNETLRHYRLDMTENDAYTLSDSTFTILEKIEQPINLYLFFSERASRNQPFLRKYYDKVKELLEEFELYSNDQIIVHFINPEPFSEEEDRADSFGLQKVPVQQGGESLYFGLAGTNAIGHVEVIPFLDSQRESFLEYDIDKMIYSLINPEKPTLGLMTSISMFPSDNVLPGDKAWVITEQLEQRFEVKKLYRGLDEIKSDEVDVLMVVHPKDLSNVTLYAIDQYVMRGGKAIFFVDPYAEIEYVPGLGVPRPGDETKRSSSLNRIFRKWGFEVNDDKIIGDSAAALSVSAPGKAAERDIVMVGYGPGNIEEDDVATARLQQIILGMPSYIRVLNQNRIKMTPLIWTTEQATLLSLIHVAKARFAQRPSMLLEDFKATGKEYPIAARIQGKLPSAFTQAPAPEPPEEEEELEEGEEPPPPPKPREDLPPHVSATDEDANLVVVADADILSDRLWVQISRFLEQRIYRPFANNRDFIVNTLENMTGDESLVGIRSRTVFSRPFTRIEEIQQAANFKFQSTEDALNKKLKESEEKLKELQSQRTDTTSNILTPEQQAEVAKSRKQMLQTRRDLREVKHNMVKDIDTLVAQIKFINIGGVPILITVFAGVFALLKRNRKKEGAKLS